MPQGDDHDGQVDYVFHVGAEQRGAGFWLTAEIGVLSLHTVPGAKEGDEITLVTMQDEHFLSRVVKVVPAKDVVLVRLTNPPQGISPAAVPARPRQFKLWHTAFRHPVHSATLSGQVDSINPNYLNSRGHRVHGLQLSAQQRLDTYDGYSGAPIEMKKHWRSPVGMIIEEIDQRTYPAVENPAKSNVLFALDISEIQDVVDIFSDIVIGADGQTIDIPPAISAEESGEAELARLRRSADLGIAPPAVVSEIDIILAAAFPSEWDDDASELGTA